MWLDMTLSSLQRQARIDWGTVDLKVKYRPGLMNREIVFVDRGTPSPLAIANSIAATLTHEHRPNIIQPFVATL